MAPMRSLPLKAASSCYLLRPQVHEIRSRTSEQFCWKNACWRTSARLSRRNEVLVQGDGYCSELNVGKLIDTWLAVWVEDKTT